MQALNESHNSVTKKISVAQATHQRKVYVRPEDSNVNKVYNTSSSISAGEEISDNQNKKQ